MERHCLRRAWLDGIATDDELHGAMQATMEMIKESELQWRSSYFEAAAEWARLAQIRQYMKRGEGPQPSDEKQAQLGADMSAAEARMTEAGAGGRAAWLVYTVSNNGIVSPRAMGSLLREEGRDPFGYELKDRLIQAFAPKE